MRTRRARSRKSSHYTNVIEHLESRYLLSGAGDLVGDAPATAEDLGVLTAAQPFFLFGTIDEAFDLDVFQFQAGSQETATIELNADFSSLDAFVRLLDSSGNELAFDDDSGPGTNSLLRFTVNGGETFFVEAGDFSSGTGDFILEISLDVGDATATALDLGTLTAAQPLNFFGTIEQASDHDFFQFQTDLAGTATIDLGADFSSIDTVVTLFDSSGIQLANNDDFGASTDSHLTFALDGGETYFVRARGFSTSTGDYELNVSIATDVVGDTIGTATDLGLLTATQPLTVVGSIDQAFDRDVFQFQAGTTGETVIELNRGAGSLDTFVTVLDSLGNVIDSDDDSGPGTDSLLSFIADANETYFVETRGFSTSTGEFSLTISVEAGDTLATATDLGVLSAAQPITVLGAIEQAFDRDFFEFQVNTPGLTLVELNAGFFSDLDTVVTVFDSSGNVIATNDDIEFLFITDSALTFLVEGGESYFVEAREFDDFVGDYRLSLTLAPDLGLLTFAQSLEVFDVIESDFDRDVFQFQAETTGTILVELGADFSFLDTVVTVLNSAGEEIAFNDDISLGIISDSRLAFAAQAGETFFVQASGFDLSIGEYQLTLTLLPDVGDTLATAQPLGVATVGQPLEVASVVNQAFDRDVFQFQADVAGSVRVELSSGSGFLDAFVSVLDSSGNVIGFDDDGGFGVDSQLTFAAEEGETYFVEARGFGSSVGEYILRITLDVGFPIASATDLGDLTDILQASGTIEAAELHDLFLFTATTDGFVEIREVASADDFFAFDGVLQAFDIDSSFPIATDFGSFDTTVPRVLIIPVVAGESYFAEVTGYFGSVGDYDLSIQMLAEIGNTIATAEDLGPLTVAAPLDFSSRIDSAPDVDVFQFQAATSGSVLVELGAEGFSFLDTVVRVLDSNGQQIAFNDDIDFASFDTDSRVSFQAEAGETYFVEASSFFGSTGDYLLHIEFDVGFPPETATNLGDLTARQPLTSSGTIEIGEFHDLFLFTATTTGTVQVQQTASASDFFALDGVLQAFNVDSSVPLASDFGTFDTTVPRVVTFSVIAGESYFAEVTGFSGSLGDYLLNLNYVVDDVPQAGVDFEFPSQAGSIEVSGDIDTYRLTAAADQTLQISLDAAAGSFLDPVVEVRVFAPNNLTTPLSTFRNDDFGFSFNSFLTVPVLQGQVIEVDARGFSSSRGGYLLTIATFNGAVAATDLIAGTSAFGNIETSRSTDVFRFSTPLGFEGMATIDVTSFGSPELVDPVVTIRETDTGSFVAFDDDSGLGLNSLVTFAVTPDTSYDVVVGGFGSRTGNYRVTLSLNASDDFGDTFDQASALSFDGNPTIERNGRITERIGDVPADVDVFSFVATSNETLRLVVTPSDGFDAGFSVFQASPLGSTADVELLAVAVPPEFGEDTGLRELFVPVTEGRTYFFRVSGLDGASGDYSLLVERRTDLVASEAPGADLLFDGNVGTPANPAGQSIDFPTDRDWYRLEATAIGEFTINLAQASGNSLDPILTIYNDQGLPIARNDDTLGLGLNSQLILQVQARRENEVFFVEATGINGTVGDYQLTVEFTAQAADDFGNDPGHFTVIPEGSPGRFTQQASLEVDDDLDFFAFTAAVGGSFTVELVARNGSPLPEGVEVQVFEVEAASLTAISLDSLTQVALITSEGGELALNLPEEGEEDNGIEVQRSPDDLLRTERHFLVAISNVGTNVDPLAYTLSINVTPGVASQNLQLLNAALFALLSLADGAAALGDQNPEAINAAIQAAMNELGKSGNFLVVLLDPVNDPVLTDSAGRQTGFTSSTGTLNGAGGYASVGNFGQVLIVPINLSVPGSFSLQFAGVGNVDQAQSSFSAFTVGQSGSAPVSLTEATLTPSESGKSNFVVQLGFGDSTSTVIPTPGGAPSGQVPSFFMMTNVMSKDRQTPADTATQTQIDDSAIVRSDDRLPEKDQDSPDPFDLAFWRDVLDGALQELQIEGLSRPTLDHVLQRLQENDSKLPADLLKNSSVGRSAKALYEVLKNSAGWLRNAKPTTPTPKPRTTVPKVTQKTPASHNAPQARNNGSTKSVAQSRG